MIVQLRHIWRYRQLLRELFVTWLKLRHTGSVLGVVWTLVNPAVFVLTYWFIFTAVIRIDLPNYASFLIPGYLAWNFTWNAVSGASESMIESNYLITKVAFPSEVLVLASVGVSLFDFLLALGLYLVVAAIAGVAFFSLAALLPLIIVAHVLFTLGIAFLSATGSVFFRDVPKLISIGTFLVFFATPIFYPESVIPQNFRGLYLFNPFVPFISMYHQALYFNSAFSTGLILKVIAFAGISLAAGMLVFRRFQKTFAEFS